MPPTRQMTSFERDMAALQLRRDEAASSENGDATERAPRQPPCLEHWDVVSGGDALADCSDTVSFSLFSLYPLMGSMRKSHISEENTCLQL